MATLLTAEGYRFDPALFDLNMVLSSQAARATALAESETEDGLAGVLDLSSVDANPDFRALSEQGGIMRYVLEGEWIEFGVSYEPYYLLTGFEVPLAQAIEWAENGQGDRFLPTVLAGDDVLLGADRNARLLGHDGADMIDGDAGDDTIEGGAGDDRIVGGAGRDTMRGGFGNDVYEVDDAGDRVIETSIGGYDAIYSTMAATTLPDHVEELRVFGHNALAKGNDLTNVLIGDDENNAFRATRTGGESGIEGVEVYDGGGGRDTIIYTDNPSPEGVDVSLSKGDRGQNTRDFGTHRLIDIENLVGTPFDDILGGSTGDNVIEGGLGDDLMDGGDGRDTVSYAGMAGDIFIDLRTEDWQDTGFTGRDLIRNFEDAVTGFGDDRLTGNDGANGLYGNEGDDVLEGRGGADRLSGGDGDDVFVYARIGDSTARAADTILDFETGADAIDLSAFGFSRADLVIAEGSLRAGGLVIEFAGDATVTAGDVIL